MERVAIAYSGGVDSSFLLKIAVDVLDGKVLAVTVNSPACSKAEIQEASNLAKALKAKHSIVDLDILKNENVAKNDPDRCYHCKKMIYSTVIDLARKEGIRHVLDASNADDVHDYRPGRKASQELNIQIPLIDAGLSKQEIRELSKKMGLSTWNKPSSACLASRIPYGVELTEPILKKVEQAEEYLKTLGIDRCRVRYHHDIARIEVSPEALPHILKSRETIVTYFKHLGFTYVTIDLEGYRTGSMNEALDL